MLCTDLDSTLRNSKGEISKENREALERFMEEGGLFSVCTGRRPDGVSLDGLMPNAPVVTLNGACLYDPAAERVLDSLLLPDSAQRAVQQLLERHGRSVECISYNTAYDGYDCVPAESGKTTEELAALVLQRKCNVFCACFFTAEEALAARADMETLPEFQGSLAFIRSWNRGVEIVPQAYTKGAGVRRLRARLGDRVKKVVCVGDYENDISMMEAADIGYAVANACPELKQAAHRVTVSNNEHALAVIIRELAAE